MENISIILGFCYRIAVAADMLPEDIAALNKKEVWHMETSRRGGLGGVSLTVGGPLGVTSRYPEHRHRPGIQNGAGGHQPADVPGPLCLALCGSSSVTG